MSFSLFHDDGVLHARIHGQTLKASLQPNVSLRLSFTFLYAMYARLDKSEYDPIFLSILRNLSLINELKIL